MSETEAKPADPPLPAYPRPREVAIDAPLTWLARGLADLRHCPGPSLFYGACFVIGGYLMILILRNAPELIPAVISGFLISGPFLAIGLYDLSRRRERGEPVQLRPTLLAWKHNAANIGVFTLVLFVLFLVWARASLVVFALFYSGAIPTMADMFRHVIATWQIDFLLAYFFVGALFSLLAFAFSVVSVPLMLDRKVDAITAVIASVRTLLANPAPMLVWAGLIALLGMLGLVTLLIGILFIGPLLGHATWHAYRDLIEE